MAVLGVILVRKQGWWGCTGDGRGGKEVMVMVVIMMVTVMKVR